MAKTVLDFGAATCISVDPVDNAPEASWCQWRKGFEGMSGELRLCESQRKHPGMKFLCFEGSPAFQGLGLEESAHLKTSYGTESFEGDLLTFCTKNTRYVFQVGTSIEDAFVKPYPY